MISVMLVDDHPVVLRGLSSLFTASNGFSIAAQTCEASQVRALAQVHRPDVIVLDIMMPGQRGIEIMAELARLGGAPRVVVLSMHANVAYIHEALRAGALAYVLKGAPADDLLTAVRKAAHGESYIGSGISLAEVTNYQQRAERAELDPYATLTRREREVLQRVVEGQTSSQVARALNLGVRTIDTHRANLMRKLNLHNHTELVRFAIGRGLILP